MENYQEARVKITKAQPNKLKCTAKNKARIILTISNENFEDNCHMNYF